MSGAPESKPRPGNARPAGSGAPLLLCLGSPMRGDDALGLLLAERLTALQRAGRIDAGVQIHAGTPDALGLVALWPGRPLLAVDAAMRAGDPPGKVRVTALWPRSSHPGQGVLLPRNTARCSSHGMGLAEALALAAQLHRMPAVATLFTVQIAQCDLGAPLSPPVAAALAGLEARLLTALKDAENAHPSPLREPDHA